MMRTSKKVGGIGRTAALVAASLTFAACGSDSGSSGSQPTTSGKVADTTQSSANGSAATAIDANWDAIVAAAEKEGKVTLYSSSVPAPVEELERRFEKAYPKIDLVLVRGLTAEIVARLDAELGSSNIQVDVAHTESRAWMESTSDAGRFSVPIGPAFGNPSFDKQRWMPKTDVFATHGGAAVWMWNTKLLPDGIKEWSDFLDSDLGGGKIGLIDPAIAPETLGNFYSEMEAATPANFLADLAAQSPRLLSSSPELVAGLSSGELFAAPYLLSPQAAAAIASGAPLASGVPPKPWTIFLFAGVTAKAPHPNAAQVLANFILESGGQEALGRGGVAVVPGTAGTLIEPNDAVVANPMPSDEAQKYGERFARLFQ